MRNLMVKYGRNNLANEIENFYRDFFGGSLRREHFRRDLCLLWPVTGSSTTTRRPGNS